MTYSSSIWLSSLVLFAGVVPLQAGGLKNPGFEEDGGWQVVTQGSRFQAAFSNTTSQTGQKSFAVSLARESPTKKEDFAGIVQVVELTHADKGISFFVKDNYTGKTKRYHWMELLLDEEVIWEADVAGGDTEWQKVSLDLTRYLKERKRTRIGRNKYRAEKGYKITFRVFERNAVNRFGVHVWADNFKLLRKTPANPQNCDKKKVPPKLNELLVYYDEDDLFQPIVKPEHFKKKRQQVIDGMLQGMGQLPDRPTRSSLEDFDIRVVNSQVRGRYTKKTISFEVAEGEVVHAFLLRAAQQETGREAPRHCWHAPDRSGRQGVFRKLAPV